MPRTRENEAVAVVRLTRCRQDATRLVAVVVAACIGCVVVCVECAGAGFVSMCKWRCDFI